MKPFISVLVKYIPLAISVLILVVGSFFVPWKQVWPLIASLSLRTWIILLILGLVFYFGRILRYWLLLRRLGQRVRFDKIAIAYLEAQPVSLLPGGEFYRSVMFKRYANVPHREGIPGIFVQSLTENFGMIVIALVCAIMLNKYVALALILVTSLAVLVGFFRWQSTKRSHRWINKLPKVSISYPKLKSFMSRNRRLLSGKNFLMLTLTSFITAFSGVGILWILAQVYGSQLTFSQAALSFTLPIVIQSVTFLPAGIGANEQTSVGILALFGVNLSLAVAITLVVRLITFILGIILGLIAMAVARIAHYRTFRA